MITRETVDLLMEMMKTVDGVAQEALQLILEELFVPDADLVAVRNELLEIMPALIATYTSASSEGASSWYQLLRESENVNGAFSTSLPEGVTETQISKSVRWAIGPAFQGDIQKAKERIAFTLSDNVKNAGRATVQHNARKDPAEPSWARVPAGRETCPFCDMLASRGFTYSSAEKAGKGNRYHAHCDCVIVPKWKKTSVQIKGYDPEKLTQRYQKALADLRENGNTTPTDVEITSTMRRIMPETYNTK